MPLSSKRFVISTSGLNSQGFRMLTTGANLEAFKKNPVLLFNHIRPTGNLKNQILPLGHWQDIKIDGDEITGVPFFDDKDEFAMSIFNKVEGDHIRMCSAGAEPIELSEDKADWLPEQTEPTVTRWNLKEASICDIGANPDSLDVALYDATDTLIKLSDNSIKKLTKKHIMNKPTTDALAAYKKAKLLKADVTKAISLAADKAAIALADETTTDADKEKLAEEEEATKEMSDEDKDAKIDELTKKLAEVTKQLADMQDEKTLAEDTAAEEKSLSLAKLAHAKGLISLAQVDDIAKLAKVDYTGTKTYLDKLKPSISLRSAIGENKAVVNEQEEKLKTLCAKSYDELFRESGALNFVKLNAPDIYKAKFKAKFGKDPKNA